MRGVLHGPVGLSAEQITDGRNVLFVLRKHSQGQQGGGGGGIQLVAEGGGGLVKEEEEDHQLTST